MTQKYSKKNHKYFTVFYKDIFIKTIQRKCAFNVYRFFKLLLRKTASDKVLQDKVFSIAKN